MGSETGSVNITGKVKVKVKVKVKAAYRRHPAGVRQPLLSLTRWPGIDARVRVSHHHA